MTSFKLSRWNFRIFLCPAAVLLFASGTAQAAFPCVTNGDELQTALTSAKTKASPYEIHLTASATPYQLGPGNDFLYLPNDMKIVGGYASGCGSRVEDASNTIIDFGGYSIGIFPDDDGATERLEIDSVTFRHGAGWAARRGAVGDFSDTTGYIIMHDVRFTDFVNDGDIAPVGMYVVKGTMQLVDVQFDHIHQNTSDPCAVHVYSDNDTSFTGNFITADLPNGKDFCFDASNEGGTFNVRVDNSIIWGSDNFGPDFATIHGLDSTNNGHPLNVSTHNVISHAFIGYGTAAAPVAQISADPHWKNPAAGDYTLADIGSPAVNSGAIGALGVPYYDINHAVRSVGSHPDRGAHESPFDDSPVLIVKSAADDGADTLRAAVTNANLYGGVHTIAFDLGTCPTVISLATPLPAITSAITVDGYTQAGSFPNDSDDVFDASLCVLIKPATAVASAFRVASNANGGTNATLALRGLGVGGFGQDVILLGGSNHTIFGNQFGGTANGVDLGSSSLGDITVGVDADSFVIGSFDPANRNVIGGSQGALGNGINVESGVVSDQDHCQIVNNWIGLAPDGVSALPNEFGIDLSGSGCAVVGNRIVGNSLVQLWINAGNNNVVQQNTIGYNTWANGLPNNATGIKISGNNNTIGGSATGSAPGLLLANYVGNMSVGGIVVDAGTGNSIRGNFVTANGPNHDGAGMDIDLGGDGPTANGVGNVGPDNLQHFAVIDSVLYFDYPPIGNFNMPGTITAHLDAAPGTYKVDVYYSEYCSATTGRGHADNYLRDIAVTIPGGSTTVSFKVPVTLPTDAPWNGLSLTATSVANGTSEMGTCFALAKGVDDAIFKSGFGTGAEY
jgi:hypothetical protein